MSCRTPLRWREARHDTAMAADATEFASVVSGRLHYAVSLSAKARFHRGKLGGVLLFLSVLRALSVSKFFLLKGSASFRFVRQRRNRRETKGFFGGFKRRGRDSNPGCHC
jgi:hypothetical protein